jgi:hypothetical protein
MLQNVVQSSLCPGVYFTALAVQSQTFVYVLRAFPMKLAFYPIQRLLSERPDALAIKRRIANR